jgi:hypothetical protein
MRYPVVQSIRESTVGVGDQVLATHMMEARVEAYNMFNKIVWENPDLNLSSPNFGQMTRKRTDGQGRQLQIGIRVVF